MNELKEAIKPHMKAQGEAKKSGAAFDASAVNGLLAEKERLDIRVAKNEVVVAHMHTALQEQLSKLGNIVDASVPVSNDEANNRVERTWGTNAPVANAPLHHSEVMWRLGAYEDEAGTKVAGQRGYFLTGPGVLINLGACVLWCCWCAA